MSRGPARSDRPGSHHDHVPGREDHLHRVLHVLQPHAHPVPRSDWEHRAHEVADPTDAAPIRDRNPAVLPSGKSGHRSSSSARWVAGAETRREAGVTDVLRNR